jgi:SAM-dependent methyltransferase
MVKYLSTAVALRCFSSSHLLRSFYRSIGNKMGNKRRSEGTMPEYYIDRLKRMVRIEKEHRFVRDGDRILELGTGWLHWEALTLRLLYDIKAVLYDVWDNRQLGGLKNYIFQLNSRLSPELGLSESQIAHARDLIKKILEVESFEELYNLLGFKYVVRNSGSLEEFQNESFDVVVSAGVLEHVKREALPHVARETLRILKPGGWAIHSIDTSDHLSHYDGTVCKKKYLTYSDTAWNRLWENEVQYINRMQRGEWLNLFKEARFELVEEETRQIDISGLRIAERFAHMPKQDLACTVVRLALRKWPCTANN